LTSSASLAHPASCTIHYNVDLGNTGERTFGMIAVGLWKALPGKNGKEATVSSE
jgi:hypothetical protein